MHCAHHTYLGKFADRLEYVGQRARGDGGERRTKAAIRPEYRNRSPPGPGMDKQISEFLNAASESCAATQIQISPGLSQLTRALLQASLGRTC